MSIGRRSRALLCLAVQLSALILPSTSFAAPFAPGTPLRVHIGPASGLPGGSRYVGAFVSGGDTLVMRGLADSLGTADSLRIAVTDIMRLEAQEGHMGAAGVARTGGGVLLGAVTGALVGATMISNGSRVAFAGFQSDDVLFFGSTALGALLGGVLFHAHARPARAGTREQDWQVVPRSRVQER